MSFSVRHMAAIALLTLSVHSAEAATATFSSDEGTLHLTENGIGSNTSTFGTDLVGMQVTATYVDGTFEVLTWENLNREFDEYAGGVSSANMSLEFRGWDYFTMTASRLLATLEMDASTGNALLDIGMHHESDVDNTPTTHGGHPYRTVSGDALTGNIHATYSNGIILNGSPRGTDTFTTVLVDYTGLEGGGFFGTTVFDTDFDTLAVQGDLTPMISTVPLPAGFPLLLAGLAAFGFCRRKQS